MSRNLSKELKGHWIPEAVLDENCQVISDFTYSYKIEMWMESFAKNIPKILEGKNLKDYPRQESRPALVIGGGPSIKDFGQLETLSKSGFKGLILSCDKLLVPSLYKGVVPEIVSSVDGDQKVALFYNKRIVKKYSNKVDAVWCAQTIHPNVVKVWNGNVYWFIAPWDNIIDSKTNSYNLHSLTLTFHFMIRKMILQTGGNVGQTLWHIANFLGCNPIGMIGMDMSYGPKTNLKNTPYWDAFNFLFKKDREKILRCYTSIKNDFFNTVNVTDIMFASYARIFNQFACEVNVETINCSPYTVLYGDNIKLMHFKDFLQKYGV